MPFQTRQNAGQQLAQKIKHLKGAKDLIILGLPRGGVVVAHEIAQNLNCPLDVIICRKIGAPGNPEFAIGAISESGGEFFNPVIRGAIDISEVYIQKTIKEEQEKIKMYQQAFRRGKPLPSLKGKTVIITDDGAATGMTMKAAIDAAQKQDAAKVIVALPVTPPDTAEEISELADEAIILETPLSFMAVGQFYAEFNQVETEEVQKILKNYFTPTSDINSL